MSARGGSVLYTSDLLALAVSLAQYPFDPSAPAVGEARSPTCGSALTFSASLPAGRIAAPGIRVTACAVGQAAAAVFMNGAVGKTRADIAATREAIRGWLAGDGPLPDWPGFEALAPARAYPGRHGAIPLAWEAALAALPK